MLSTIPKAYEDVGISIRSESRSPARDGCLTAASIRNMSSALMNLMIYHLVKIFVATSSSIKISMVYITTQIYPPWSVAVIMNIGGRTPAPESSVDRCTNMAKSTTGTKLSMRERLEVRG